MITESMGKIIGMAMAYAVSTLGLLLAYYNYRKRTVKADKVFTRTAWAVAGGTLGAVVVAVIVVFLLANAGKPEATISPEAVEPAMSAEATGVRAPTETPDGAKADILLDRKRWPMVGIVIPGAIFLFSTWITWALYKHFSKKTQGQT